MTKHDAHLSQPTVPRQSGRGEGGGQCGHSRSSVPIVGKCNRVVSGGRSKNAIVGYGRCGDRWSDLMLAAQQGDDLSYATLLQEINQWLFRYFRRRMPHEVAEEHCQEVLLAIHLRKETYVASGPFGPWMAGIARFKWIDHLRCEYRKPILGSEVEMVCDDHRFSALSKVLVATLLGELKPAQASAIRLVKLAGASVEEAAAATGQSRSLIKVNVHRGLKQMAKRLGGKRSDDQLGCSLSE